MPGLLDLPPELIEQIHFAREQLFSAEREIKETDTAVAPGLGNFRLVNRYIERATRRAFVEKHFALWYIKAPDDAEIKKFSNMARTPDLAAAVQELDILVDDDYTMVVQGTSSPMRPGTQDAPTSSSDVNHQFDNEHSKQVGGSHPISSEVRATHAFDSITGALVPAAYLRHRLALITAFRACKNVTELWIGNKSLEPERMLRYKHSSRGNGIVAPPEDNGHEQDADEGEDDDDYGDASDDAGDDWSGSADEDEDEDGQSGYGDEDQNEADDTVNLDSEYQDQVEESVDYPEEQGGDSQDSGDPHNEHSHDHRDILFDVTLSYNYVLHLAAEAGMCPGKIIPFHECSEIVCARMRVGLTDCAGLVRSKDALKRLVTLNLGFVRDQHTLQGDPFEQCGLRLGKQIVEAFAHMPVLHRLRVDFELANGVAAWSMLAKAPAIPTLKELFLETCIMNMDDFASFVGKHCPTWTSMTISHMHICNGTMEELGDLYERLSQAPNIEVYRQRLFFLGVEHDEHIGVPGQVSCPILDDVEDEDGFVTIYQTDWIRWKGHDDVVRVLGVMAEHMHS